MLTEREFQLLMFAFQNLKQKPDINYEGMARSAGLKGAKSARDSFNVVYKKLVASNASNDKSLAANASASAPPNKKRKAESVENVDDEDDDEKVAPLAPPATPAKKKAAPRKTKVKNEEKTASTADDDALF